MTSPYNNGLTTLTKSRLTTAAPRSSTYRDRHTTAFHSDPDDFGALSANTIRLLYKFVQRKAAEAADKIADMVGAAGGRGRQQRLPLPIILTQAIWWRLRGNLTRRRLFSVPHLLVGLWIVVLLWGERWIFHAKVAHCDWDNWEKWPQGATPHHLIFVADPQIMDAHSYPGRPWPLNSLTMTILDNYMRRSYRELQEQLHPDTLFFLGDLFDGGREWKPRQGTFQEPEWSSRPEGEKAWAKTWRKKYDDQYWLREYARFGDIFFDPWNLGGSAAGNGQRGRRLIASLPGNHDLGFGSELQQSVRNRFECYFGEGNRVDVIGNHTFVSVDTVSLSADTSDRASQPDIQPIYGPAQQFLDGVAWTKQKAVARELRHQRGAMEEISFPHKVEDLDQAQFDVDGIRRAIGSSGSSTGEGSAQPQPPADLPTVLLTHVPLYRPPGTPCGPLREHWPPSKPSSEDVDADGNVKPVFPDHRNAISVTRGYQYQNVLSEADSIKLVKSIGNVVHAFSGDDHDYCEVVHDEQQDHVHEITVKSFSMGMGIPTPGFLMLSLYNPIDGDGRPLAASAAKTDANAPTTTGNTVQIHMCLLPNQLGTFARYAGMIVVSLVLLAARAVLVPILGWQPFALDPHERPLSASGGSGGRGGALRSSSRSPSLLPMFSKAKVEDDEYGRVGSSGGSGGGGAAAAAAASGSNEDDSADASGNEKGGASGSSGFFALQSAAATYSRGRNQANGRFGSERPGDTGLQPPYQSQSQTRNQSQHQHRHKNRSGRPRRSSKASASLGYGPKIQIIRDEDDSYNDDDTYDNFANDDYYHGSDGRDAYSFGGGNRWQPASRRRRVLGVSRSVLTSLKRFVWGVLGLRGSGRGRWRQAGFGIMYQGLNGGDGGSQRRRRGGGLGAGDGRSTRGLLRMAGREFWTTAWRVAWMVVLFWAWLNHKG